MCSIGYWLCVSGGNLRFPQVVHDVWACLNGVNLNSSTLLCLNFVCLVCPNPQTDYSDITQVKNRPPLIVMKEEARSTSFFYFFILFLVLVYCTWVSSRSAEKNKELVSAGQVGMACTRFFHFWLFQIRFWSFLSAINIQCAYIEDVSLFYV